MATHTLNFGLNLGATHTGLTDLRAQLLDTDEQPVGSAISTGFAEIGGGSYTWEHTFTTTFDGYVKFYSNAAPSSPFFVLSVDSEDVTIPSSTSPDTVNAYIYTRNAVGTPVAGKVVSYRMIAGPDGLSGSYPDDTYTTTSDETGLVTIVMVKGAYYQYWLGNGRARTVQITAQTADPYELPAVTE